MALAEATAKFALSVKVSPAFSKAVSVGKAHGRGKFPQPLAEAMAHAALSAKVRSSLSRLVGVGEAHGFSLSLDLSIVEALADV